MTSEADAKDRRDSDRFAEKVHVRLHPIERWASRYYIGLLILIVVVGIAIAIRTSASLNRTNALANLLLTWGIGVVVVVASSTVGCFLGFLFGIPRSLQRAS